MRRTDAHKLRVGPVVAQSVLSRSDDHGSRGELLLRAVRTGSHTERLVGPRIDRLFPHQRVEGTAERPYITVCVSPATAPLRPCAHLPVETLYAGERRRETRRICERAPVSDVLHQRRPLHCTQPTQLKERAREVSEVPSAPRIAGQPAGRLFVLR